MLVHIKKIVKAAQKGKYAIGAFNVCNLETALAVARAAQALKSPAIIQLSEKTIAYAGFDQIVNIIKTAANDVKAPIAIHLDHGRDPALIKKCVEAGFSSVMRDASDLPLLENIKAMQKTISLAHGRGIWVQGELGSIKGKEGLTSKNVQKDESDFMTDPKQVPEFIEKTKLDALAVSVGTMHGFFQGKEKIDFKRLKAIKEKTNIPLVLHGASGVEKKDIRKAIKSGIRIINVDTELRMAFTKALTGVLKRKKIITFDPREILEPSIKAVQKAVEEKMKIFGS